MDELPDLSDEDAATAWFKTQPVEVGITVAARSSLRVLPELMGNFAPQVASDSKLRWQFGCFRANCVSAAAAVCPAAETDLKNRLAHAAGDTLAGSVGGVEAAESAARSAAARFATRSETHSARAAGQSLARSAAAHAAARSAAKEDAAQAVTSCLAAFNTPLWPDSTDVPKLVKAWSDYRDAHENDPIWGFWVRWYNGMWTGQPLDWDLTTQVALIPDDVWINGPAAVAGSIREIEARYALKAAIDAAEVEFPRSYAQRHGIGGNNPPETIDAYETRPQALEIIWEPFEDLREQIESDEPDKEKTKTAIEKLAGLLSICAGWIGGKIDVFATEYAKAIGKLAAPTTVAWLTSQTPFVKTVLEAAKNWLSTLGG